jgi:Bacterial Ig domain
MKIKFVKDVMVQRLTAASWSLWQTISRQIQRASEGKSLSFAAVVPFMKARMPTHPGLTTGFATGPASVNGTNGNFSAARLPIRRRISLLLTGAAITLSTAGSAAGAIENDPHTSDFASSNKPERISQSAQASARIVSLDEVHPRVHFKASGLPVGLEIDPKTGVIGGIFDREANRNNGAPFIVTVHIALGNAASGASTIKLHIENRPPTAIDDTLYLSKKPLQINVLANDADADGDRLVLTDAGATHGTVAFMADGLIIYGSNHGNVRADTINYTISDGHGGVAVGKVVLVAK